MFAIEAFINKPSGEAEYVMVDNKITAQGQLFSIAQPISEDISIVGLYFDF